MTTFENEYQWEVIEHIEYYNYVIEISKTSLDVFMVTVLNNDGSLNAHLTPIFNQDFSKESLIEKCQIRILEGCNILSSMEVL